MQGTTIAIEGMRCGHCIARVNRALAQVGELELRDAGVGWATIAYDPQVVSVDRITRALEQQGYRVRL
jgi:copper chaperone